MISRGRITAAVAASGFATVVRLPAEERLMLLQRFSDKLSSFFSAYLWYTELSVIHVGKA